MKISIEPEKFAYLIREYRKKNKLSQLELANLIGVARFTVFRWEHMKVNVSPAIYKFLCHRNIIPNGGA